MARADNSVGLTPIVAIGAGLGVAWLILRERDSKSEAATAPIDPHAATVAVPPVPTVVASAVPPVVVPGVATEAAVELPPGRWVWPLPRWRGRAPVISDGWGSPRDGGTRLHMGADLMYRRAHLADLVAQFPPVSPHSTWHFVPDGTVALAAADATIWSAGRTARGWTVVLSHGKPWATYYTHLSSLLVPETARGVGGYRVAAGQPIGIVGADPTNPKVRHLHFEIWKGGNHNAAIDPAPILRRLAIVDQAPVTTIKAFS